MINDNESKAENEKWNTKIRQEINLSLDMDTDILSIICVSVLWWLYVLKGPLSGLRQFLTTERLLKMMKNAFYFILKALFVLEIFKFLSSLFGHVEKTAWVER